jgi:DNA invertase Pin-like site-specific DNA recombinase
MLTGYALNFADELNFRLQKDALRQAGCATIFEDYPDKTGHERPAFRDALKSLNSGDTLIVWRLDRLSHSMKHLVDTIRVLSTRNIALKSLQEALTIDIASDEGQLACHIFGALAEFEHNILRARTRIGLEAARSRGNRGGRPPSLDDAMRSMIADLYSAKKYTVGEICLIAGVSKPTIYKCLHAAGEFVTDSSGTADA